MAFVSVAAPRPMVTPAPLAGVVAAPVSDVLDAAAPVWPEPPERVVRVPLEKRGGAALMIVPAAAPSPATGSGRLRHLTSVLHRIPDLVS